MIRQANYSVELVCVHVLPDDSDGKKMRMSACDNTKPLITKVELEISRVVHTLKSHTSDNTHSA